MSQASPSGLPSYDPSGSHPVGEKKKPAWVKWGLITVAVLFVVGLLSNLLGGSKGQEAPPVPAVTVVSTSVITHTPPPTSVELPPQSPPVTEPPVVTTETNVYAPAPAPAPLYGGGATNNGGGAGIAGPSGGHYSSCKAARAAGVAPMYQGDPNYSSGLDRDHDGVACE